MKTFIKTLAAATAMVAIAGTANAQSLGSGTFSTAGNGGQNVGPMSGGSTSDTFLITGTVPRECSFFTGGASTTINLGNIGIVGNANVAVENAFDMAGPVTGSATTSTAGCNFRNNVTITKSNGPLGLLNANAAGYDSNQFQANIPYQVQAVFTASNEANAIGGGVSEPKVTVLPNETTKVEDFGAWRSQFVLNVDATAAPKALVAGDYTDTVTVLLQTF